jgi:hypothetical protein
MVRSIAMLPYTSRSDRAIRRTVVDLAAAGAQTIAPAVEGRRVRILGFWLTASTAGTMLFEDTDDTPAALAPAIQVPDGSIEIANAGLESTVDGLGVTLTTTTAVAVSGVVFWSYV